MLEHGAVEATVLRQAYRRGVPPPEFISGAPELREDLQPYWVAFDELSSCRSYAGMAGVPQPIPWTAINEYAIRHRFAGEAFDDLVDLVRAMDTAFLKHAAEKVDNGNPE